MDAQELERDMKAWRHHLHAMPDLGHLGCNAGAAIDSHHAKSGQMAAELAQFIGDLEAQFARRTEEQHLRLAARGIEALQQRQPVGARLAGAGLGQADKIGFAGQQHGDGLLLNGHRRLEAHFGHSPDQFGLQAQ